MNEDGKMNAQDAELTKEKTLPSATGTVVSGSIDIGQGDQFLAAAELVAEVPALTTTELPDGQINTYKLEESADDSTWNDLKAALIVQTGAGAAGDGAASARFRLASTAKRYTRLSCTGSATIGNQSAKNMVLSLRT